MAIENDSATLAEDLASAWDEETVDETPQDAHEDEIEEETIEDTDEEEEAPEIDESEEDDSDEESEDEPDDEGLVAPDHWRKEDKEMFNSLSDEAKEFVHRRYSMMEKDYHNKTQAIAMEKRFNEEIKSILNPFRSDFEMRGMDDVAAIRQLVAAHNMLQSQPKDAIKILAKQYNVDLGEDDDFEYEDETTSEIKRLEKKIAQLEAGTQQKSIDDVNREIERFKNQTDEAGKPVHPHFEAVYQDMVALVRAGAAKDLDSAYEKAIWANDEVRKQLMAEGATKETRKRAEEAKKRAAKAKRAAKVNVKGKSEPRPESAAEKSLREELAELYDKNLKS